MHRHRRWIALVGTIAVGLSCLLLPYGAGASPMSAAETPNLVTAYRVLSWACQGTPSGQVRARVTVRMKVVNYDHLRDWAQRMKVKARLVPSDSPGLSYHRDWREVVSGLLIQNRTHTRDMTVVTAPASPNAAWNVQIKLVWDRVAPIPDVVKQVTKPFICAGTF